MKMGSEIAKNSTHSHVAVRPRHIERAVGSQNVRVIVRPAYRRLQLSYSVEHLRSVTGILEAACGEIHPVGMSNE